MGTYILLIIVVSLSALFSYTNHKILKLPFVIGLFFQSMLLSLFILSSKFWANWYYNEIRNVIEHINLSHYILDIMLWFLLFAGAFNTNWFEIKKNIKTISIFAVLWVIFSTIIISWLLYQVALLFSVNIPYIYCLLFGALISPTDPIAVLWILIKAKAPKKVESIIIWESLFNDGIWVVLFVVFLEMLRQWNLWFDMVNFSVVFIEEAIWWVLFGLLLWYALHKILKSIDDYESEILITLAFVMLWYKLSTVFHVSWALAMVIMWIFVWNYNIKQSMWDKTMDYVLKFWELVDVVLNAILFIMISFVLINADFHTKFVYIWIIWIFIVLLSRIIVIYAYDLFSFKKKHLTSNDLKLLVWWWLRWWLSIALVLSLPSWESKDILLIVTYFCVVFSVLLQWLTIKKLIK